MEKETNGLGDNEIVHQLNQNDESKNVDVPEDEDVNFKVSIPKVGMYFESCETLFERYSAYATQEGFAAIKT